MVNVISEHRALFVILILVLLIAFFVYVNDPDYFKVAAIYWGLGIFTIFLYIFHKET